jgi:hypothetical protein
MRRRHAAMTDFGVDANHNPPGRLCVIDPQFLTTWADVGHGTQMRHHDRFTTLQSAQEKTRLDSRFRREGRGQDFPV